ncbi:hypothetical protein M378DRAFT_404952 [Amanita muscaria Koide BX008]|uniref:Uncharacterized protein n=1 Tax=Amanita muscaria (strain Koide BX008) TaxID=946122 RepID=A0A0C2TH10_AMAMK|nr:hypothetical protein M378DRAFT_404952 [Amanita muscaria Koide BX008]
MYPHDQEDSLRQPLLDDESDVQVIAPPLRSTVSSREADDLEDTPTQTHVRNEQSMPLLVGLVDSSVARGSLDRPIPLSASDGIENADLEHIAAKSTTGGGVLDSVANMANSILGAGIIGRWEKSHLSTN